MLKIKKLFLDILAPKNCYICKQKGSFICQNCFDKIKPFPSQCYICKTKSNNFNTCQECKNRFLIDKVIVLSYYEGVISSLIKDAKFKNKHDIYNDIIPFLYNKFILNEKMIRKDDYILVWIPSHFLRRFKRGYDTSNIICKAFSKESWIKYERKIIKKIKNTKQQSHLTKELRLSNLNWTFEFNQKYKEKLSWKTVIIIDDVMSTWSTINEISKVLKMNWAKKLIWLIIASW